MTTLDIPINTYTIRQQFPTRAFGSPAFPPLSAAAGAVDRVLLWFPIAKVPTGVTITSAKVLVYNARAAGDAFDISVRPNTSTFRSNVTWNTQPTYGAVTDTETVTAPALGALYELDVLAPVVARNSYGFMLSTTDVPVHYVYGSASARRPVLRVEYLRVPAVPGGLTPNGGAVSVAQPVLTFAGDEDMEELEVEIDDAGVVWSSGWVSSGTGYFDPATGVGAPVLSAGESVLWRARVRNPEGTSAWSGWATYSYEPLPSVAITSPGATSSDGSPTLQWTTTDQTQFRASLHETTTLIESTPGWVNEAATRAWTPGKGVPIPGHVGRFTLEIRDDVLRVAAVGAPTHVFLTHQFTTTLTGAGTGVSTISAAYDEPVVTLAGTRAAGIPDEVALLRDGVIVPLWNAAGEVGLKMPGSDFFTGTAFTVKDYTVPGRGAHTWTLLTYTGGVVSATNPSASLTLFNSSVWLVHPPSGEKVEIFGYNDLPQVEQTVGENSILHLPVTGGPLVEPTRRRLIRTTRAGTIVGSVQNEDEETLLDWAEGFSGERYRLVFGKVNWSVILGDYSPTDVFYDNSCGPDRVQVSLAWWERLRDF